MRSLTQSAPAQPDPEFAPATSRPSTTAWVLVEPSRDMQRCPAIVHQPVPVRATGATGLQAAATRLSHRWHAKSPVSRLPPGPFRSPPPAAPGAATTRGEVRRFRRRHRWRRTCRSQHLCPLARPRYPVSACCRAASHTLMAVRGRGPNRPPGAPGRSLRCAALAESAAARAHLRTGSAPIRSALPRPSKARGFRHGPPVSGLRQPILQHENCPVCVMCVSLSVNRVLI